MGCARGYGSPAFHLHGTNNPVLRGAPLPAYPPVPNFLNLGVHGLNPSWRHEVTAEVSALGHARCSPSPRCPRCQRDPSLPCRARWSLCLLAAARLSSGSCSSIPALAPALPGCPDGPFGLRLVVAEPCLSSCVSCSCCSFLPAIPFRIHGSPPPNPCSSAVSPSALQQLPPRVGAAEAPLPAPPSPVLAGVRCRGLTFGH